VFDEFGFIDAFGGGGADIAPIAFDSGSIADTAWTPSFDSSMMSPEMAMGGAGGFDGQMSDIVGALASAGRFDLIPPVMEAAGFDMSGPDPLAPLAQAPSEAMPTMPEAEALPVPSLMSLMTQPPEAPAFMAPWNPMGELGQSTFNPSPLPQQPLVINPEQQYGAQSFDEGGFTGPSYPVETHNLTWDQAEGLHKLGLLNGGWRGAPDLGIEAANSYEWGSQYAQPRENIPTSEYAPGGRADQVADQVTQALQGQSGAQSFDESGFSLPPLQHQDGGPFGSRGNVSSSDTSPDFNWVFGQPEAPAPSSIINDHFKGYEPLNGAQSFDEGGFSPQPFQHNDGGPMGSRGAFDQSPQLAGLSDGPAATFGGQQEQVPLPQPRPPFSNPDMGQYRQAIGQIESSNRYDKLGPVITSGAYRGDQAYGRYGIMGNNIPAWSKDALGYSVGKQEFLNNPQLQDRVFDHRFGNYVTKYGPEGASKAWFGGERGMLNPNAKDQLGTSVAGYGDKFANLTGAQPLRHNDGGPMGSRGASGAGEQVAALAPANAESIPIPGVKVVNAVDPNGKFGLSATKNAEPFKSVVFHHTGSDNVQSALNTLKKGDPFRGGGSFGYHYYIDKDGTVYQGAPLNVRTNHVMPSSSSLRTAGDGVDNKNSIGISFVGSGKETPEQIASGTKVAAAVMQQYGIKPDSVFGHGELQKNRESGEGMSAVAAIRNGAAVQVAENQAPATLAKEANKDFSANKPIPGDQATQTAQNSAARPLEETTVPTRMAQASRVPDTGQRTMYDGDVGGGQNGGGFPSLISSLFGGGQQQGGMPAIMGGGRNPFNDPGSLAAMELIVNSLSRAAPIHGLAQSQIQSNQYAEQQASKQAMYMAAKQMGFSDQEAAAFMHNPQAMQMVQQWKQQQTDQAAASDFSRMGAGGGGQSLPTPATQPAPAVSPNMLSPTPLGQQQPQAQQQAPAPSGANVPLRPQSNRTMGPNPREILEFLDRNRGMSSESRKKYLELYKHAMDAYKPTNDQSNYGFYWDQEVAAGRVPKGVEDWRLTEVREGRQQTIINTGDKADAEFSKKFAGANAERWGEYLKQGDVAKGRMSDIDIMREASRNLGSQGVAANVKATFGPYLEAAGVDVTGLSDIQTWEAVTKRIAPTLRVPGSGSTSNIEYEGMLKGLGPLSNNPAAREAILDTFEASSRNEIERGRIASLLATDQISRTEAEKMVQALPDPMTSFREWRKANPDAYAEALKQGRATTEKPGDKKGEPAPSGPPKNFDKMPVNDQLNWLQRNAPEGTEFTIKETGNKYRIENGKAVPVKKDKKEQ
jgi:hypothetical protein